MRVELEKLKDNPLRDFEVDPVDEESVREIRGSIKDDDFWGGVVARKTKNGALEIAAGHTRVRAAIAEGIKSSDLIYVSDNMTDAQMVRIYARENSTQRGGKDNCSASAGSVAAAIRLLARALLTGSAPESREHTRSDQGIGAPAIHQALKPALYEDAIARQLAILKASGDYARIIREVGDEILAENADALKEANRIEKERLAAEERERIARESREKAEADKAKAKKDDDDKKQAQAEERRIKAAADEKAASTDRKNAEKKAEKHADVVETKEKVDAAVAAAEGSETARPGAARSPEDRIFDRKGVAQYLKKSNQVDAFFRLVTSANIRRLLDVDKQAALAKHLCDKAKADGFGEPTVGYMREHLNNLVLGVKRTERRVTEEDREAARLADFKRRNADCQHEFARDTGRLIKNALKLAEIQKAWPKGTTWPILPEFRTAARTGAKAFTDLHRLIG